jgi:serine/threonine protein kinase
MTNQCAVNIKGERGSVTSSLKRRMSMTDSEEKSSVQADKKFGRYIVQKLLGEGAMGKVFLAQDPVLNRQVAIKVISVDRHLDEKTRQEFLSRFTLEARLSAQLNHQSIVPVYDAGEEEGVPWIAFQFIDGVTLDKIIRNKGKLSVKWSVHIALDIASALQLAHSQHIVHRDIKPGNIMVDRQGGVAKLTDFGVAKVPWASLTCEGNAMGSPGYMSPEQIEGFSVDERSDLFSLGVVLYEMLTGRHPFVRETVAATAFATIGGKYPQAGELVTGIPPQLDEVIDRCLTPKPDDRVKNASQLIGLLKNTVPADGSGSGVWPVAGEKKPEFSKVIAAGIDSFSAILKRAAPQKKAPPTLVSASLVHSPRRSSPIATQARNAFRTALFIVRKTLRRTLKRSAEAVSLKLLGGSALSVGVLIVVLIVAINKSTKEEFYFPMSGLDAEQKILVNKCRSWASAGIFDSAIVYATALAATKEGGVNGNFLLGTILCRKGDYDGAFLSFEMAQQFPSGARLLEKNNGYIVSLCMPVLTKKRAPDPMVSILAKKCSAADVAVIRNAVYEKPYWLRWNSLRILQAAGKQVDLVRVFILDLKYSRTMKTRLQAVSDLGELGDKRAIPALKESARKGLRDPFVSSAANRTLREVFKE